MCLRCSSSEATTRHTHVAMPLVWVRSASDLSLSPRGRYAISYFTLLEALRPYFTLLEALLYFTFEALIEAGARKVRRWAISRAALPTARLTPFARAGTRRAHANAPRTMWGVLTRGYARIGGQGT